MADINVEVIALGSELLQGRDNSDLVYISKRLAELGYTLTQAHTVSDNVDLIAEVFKGAIKRGGIIIATGGLGPTFDDLTRDALSKAIKRNLVFDKKLFKVIERRFQKRGADCPEENKRQAHVFEKSEALHNEFGTAPGLWVDIDKNTTVILLPGPPNELTPMFESAVIRRILKKHKPPFCVTANFYMCGLSESEVNHKILQIVNGDYPKNILVDFTILANIAVVEFRFTAKGRDKKILLKTAGKISAKIREIFGGSIYSEHEYDLAKVAGERLLKNKQTLSIAESCTGGLIAGRVTDVPGSSKYMICGFVPYSNKLKVDVLGVKKTTIDKFGAVSQQVVEEMLFGVKKISGSDCALAVSGIAGPGGGSKSKPVGLVYIGVLSPKGCKVVEHHFSGGRDRIRQITVNKALDMLRSCV